MPKALVFINTRYESGEVVKDLEKVSGVREAHISLGMYDAVAMVEANSFSEVKDIVAKGIRNLDSVKSTLTLTLVESPLS